MSRDRQLVSIAQAAERLGVHHMTIRRRIADGTLPAYRMGKQLIRLELDDVDALLRAIPNARTLPRRTGRHA